MTEFADVFSIPEGFLYSVLGQVTKMDLSVRTNFLKKYIFLNFQTKIFIRLFVVIEHSHTHTHELLLSNKSYLLASHAAAAAAVEITSAFSLSRSLFV